MHLVNNLFIIYSKVLIFGKLNSSKQKKETIESNDDDVPMDEDDEKLFELTKSNTMVNRDILKKEKTYLKKIEPQYKEIYGDKGIQFCKEENKNNINKNNNNNNIIEQGGNTRKNKRKVKFSSIVQHSRN